MTAPMSAASIQGSDPVAVAVLSVVLFVLPVIGYAIWFVTEWRQHK